MALDAENYDTALPGLCGAAIRGTIFDHEKLLLLRPDSGEVKIPGGGQECGGTDPDTLAREALEKRDIASSRSLYRKCGEAEEKDFHP